MSASLMQNNTPSMKQAYNIWLDGIKYREEHFDFPLKDEYIFHTQGIAFASRLIASHISGMDAQKAYICGLLHDYGKKYNEREIGRFHGLIGFQELKAMGFSLPSRICLTHTFADKNINIADFPSYPQEDLQLCQSILSSLEYDDYDRLVQFVDRLFEGFTIIPFSERAQAIGQRYHLSDAIVGKLIKDGQILKNYLDCLCGENVYKILGLE